MSCLFAVHQNELPIVRIKIFRFFVKKIYSISTKELPQTLCRRCLEPVNFPTAYCEWLILGIYFELRFFRCKIGHIKLQQCDEWQQNKATKLFFHKQRKKMKSRSDL